VGETGVKLVLLQPPIRDFYETEQRLQPMGLCSLKAVLNQRLPHLSVRVLDFHQGRGRRTAPLPKELQDLRSFYEHPDKSPFSTFHNYYHFGADYERAAEEVSNEAPDLVGISCLFTPYYREALACAAAIKKRRPTLVVMGGGHATVAPESLLANQAVDYVIRGEGERPLVELCQALLTGGPPDRVPNLGYKENGRLCFTDLAPNYALEGLPAPDFSDLSPSRYQYKGRPMAFVTSSRGCPHACAFCSARTIFGGYRPRPVEQVLAEIGQRYDEGYRVIDFEDDNLTANRKRFHELLDGLSATFPARGLQYLAMNGVSYHGLDRATLARMREVGFEQLNLSLVSARQDSLGRAARPHRVRDFVETASSAVALGFGVTAYQIVGLPYERVEDMLETLALLARLPVLAGASIFYLTPGSGLAQGLNLGEEEHVRARSTALALAPGACFEREDLYSLLVTARIINFLKGITTEGRAVRLEEALSLAGEGDERSRLGAELLIRVLRERRLYAATGRGFAPLRRFKAELLLETLRRAGRIGALDGGTIALAGALDC
jgi:radical SAM superfamily enzyme YgiQ (UPF0313 family)